MGANRQGKKILKKKNNFYLFFLSNQKVTLSLTQLFLKIVDGSYRER